MHHCENYHGTNLSHGSFDYGTKIQHFEKTQVVDCVADFSIVLEMYCYILGIIFVVVGPCINNGGQGEPWGANTQPQQRDTTTNTATSNTRHDTQHHGNKHTATTHNDKRTTYGTASSYAHAAAPSTLPQWANNKRRYK